jgi:hypothetical protein
VSETGQGQEELSLAAGAADSVLVSVLEPESEEELLSLPDDAVEVSLVSLPPFSTGGLGRP